MSRRAACRTPWRPATLSYLMDHRIGGTAVIPAAHLMQSIAETVQARVPSCDVSRMRAARFAHAIPVDGAEARELWLRLEEGEPLEAAVESTVELASGIVRTYEHASLQLGAKMGDPRPPPPPAAAEFTVDAARVYESLVPLGPSFQNLRGALVLGASGARAVARADGNLDPVGPLGSPFLLDAAMHLACVWGQRYLGTIAYPAGFASRWVLSPVRREEVLCIAEPRGEDGSTLLFDLWIVDDKGRLRDHVERLSMVPQRGGAAPPAWIRIEGAR